MEVRTLRRYSWEMEGKAEVKSKRIQALFSCMREECMEAVSMSNKFTRIERPCKNPCCRGRTHGDKCASQRCLAALATILLSQFTMLKGFVFSAVNIEVPSCKTLVDFFGKQTKVDKLKL